MVTARCVKDGLDSIAYVQQRRALPSASSHTHHGRRGNTSITLSTSSATFKMTLFPEARLHATTPSCSENISFIIVFHAELHWSKKYTEMYQHLNIASLFSLAIVILHENVLGKNASVEGILEPQHDQYSPAIENQPKTYEHVLNT